MKKVKTLFWGFIFTLIYILTPLFILLPLNTWNFGSDSGAIGVILLIFIIPIFINQTIKYNFKINNRVFIESIIVSILWLLVELLLFYFILTQIVGRDDPNSFGLIGLIIIFVLYIPFSLINIVIGVRILK